MPGMSHCYNEKRGRVYLASSKKILSERPDVIRLLAITKSLYDDGTPEALIEYAGRVCYCSEVNSDTRERFIRRRIEQGHESILEHCSATVEISGISRACSHQLVRHRLASYSQESQRYVDMSGCYLVVPQSVSENSDAMRAWNNAASAIDAAYTTMVDLGIRREDARFILPNASQTRLVMTANFREWLHIFRLRITPEAQWEIREVCTQIRDVLREYAPAVFL